MSVIARILAKSAAEPVRVMAQGIVLEPRTPPNEIQLWDSGDNPTDYGIHKWTARSIEAVMARYIARGNPLLIDVEHNGATLGDDGEKGAPAVTGGYARLEVRNGAPWLVFDWSAFAVEQIATGQRRFLSPEYDVDRNTGEILALYRVSLVADPGTHRARMLAAAQKGNGMDPKLAAIMAILSSVADPAAAIDAIKSLVANLDQGDAPPADAPPGGEPMAAAGDAPPADAPPGGDKGKVAAGTSDDTTQAPAPTKAAAPAKPTPVTPPAGTTVVVTASGGGGGGATPAPTDAVRAAAGAAVLQIENAQRDHMLATQGDRLVPSIRKWASTQPYAVVKGLIEAAPTPQEPTKRTAATRGAGHGQEAQPEGLPETERIQLQKLMGTHKASAPEPHELEGGRVLVLPTVPPSVHRERKRAAAAAAIAAGKAGK